MMQLTMHTIKKQMNKKDLKAPKLQETNPSGILTLEEKIANAAQLARECGVDKINKEIMKHRNKIEILEAGLKLYLNGTR